MREQNCALASMPTFVCTASSASAVRGKTRPAISTVSSSPSNLRTKPSLVLPPGFCWKAPAVGQNCVGEVHFVAAVVVVKPPT
jgi:hypothetical protein